MSLTLFFIVVSLAIGYLLYDTFKKSRQKTNKTTETFNSRLKINYSNQCAVLSTLSKQKMDSIKTKTISINLVGDPIEPSIEEIMKIKQIIVKLLPTRRIYLLQNKQQNRSNLFKMLYETIGSDFTIPYSSVQGAIAILRQLSCGLHLQSNRDVYTKIKQYLNKIWLAGQDPQQQAIREFKTQIQMLSFLSNIQAVQSQQKK